MSKSRSPQITLDGITSSGIKRSDLGRLLGQRMREAYEASLPTEPLPDELAKLVARLQGSKKAR
jgi:hypothetical protein